MGKIGFMLLGGAITIVGLGVLILIIMLVSWIQGKIIMHKINKRSNLSNQLAKAKEIIKKIEKVFYSGENAIKRLSEISDILAEAKQFLSEVKK